jgi:hypothetical protein
VAEVLQQMESGLQPGQIIVNTTSGEPEQTATSAKRLAARAAKSSLSPLG